MAREPMTDWKKFALLLFAIGAIAVVVFVWMTISGNLSRMV